MLLLLLPDFPCVFSCSFCLICHSLFSFLALSGGNIKCSLSLPCPSFFYLIVLFPLFFPLLNIISNGNSPSCAAQPLEQRIRYQEISQHFQLCLSPPSQPLLLPVLAVCPFTSLMSQSRGLSMLNGHLSVCCPCLFMIMNCLKESVCSCTLLFTVDRICFFDLPKTRIYFACHILHYLTIHFAAKVKMNLSLTLTQGFSFLHGRIMTVSQQGGSVTSVTFTEVSVSQLSSRTESQLAYPYYVVCKVMTSASQTVVH